MHFRNVLFVALVCAMAAFAQNPITADSPFQVRYAANPAAGESWINIVNTGAQGAAVQGPGFGRAAGNICANVYAFSPDEQLISCCSCLITANGVVNLGVNRDLTIKTLTGVVPTSVVVKVLATWSARIPGSQNPTSGPGEGTSCTNSAALAGTGDFLIIPAGMAVWGTTLHAAPGGGFHTTETAFTPSTLNQTGAPANVNEAARPADSELASITGRCSSILGNGSGFGQCLSCRAGALGGVKK